MEKNNSIFFKISLIILGFLTSCHSRYAQRDIVYFRDGSSRTGSIIASDTQKVVLESFDLSKQQYQWKDIDSVTGLSNNSLFLGFHVSLGRVPYYTAFTDKVYSPFTPGFEWMIGRMKHAKVGQYAFFQYYPTPTFSARKIGYGYQYYLWKGYSAKHSACVGSEFALMNITLNTGPQVTFSPFMGYDYKLTGRYSLSARMGLQRNIGSRNTDWGLFVSAGIRWMRIDYDKRYRQFNQVKHR